MTYRERREARAERLREWARKREVKAAAVFEAGKPYTSDNAFNTQPGHIPFRAKLIAREDRAYESLSKAREMSTKADNIEAAAGRAIYSDDENAVEALEARIASLEAERGRIKAYNASCRKGAPDTSLLDEAQRANLAVCLRVQPYACKNGTMPAYELSNLSGNIARNRKRLASLTR